MGGAEAVQPFAAVRLPDFQMDQQKLEYTNCLQLFSSLETPNSWSTLLILCVVAWMRNPTAKLKRAYSAQLSPSLIMTTMPQAVTLQREAAVQAASAKGSNENGA
jgi:hypothetical protein